MAGKKVHCPKCQSILQVPSGPETDVSDPPTIQVAAVPHRLVTVIPSDSGSAERNGPPDTPPVHPSMPSISGTPQAPTLSGAAGWPVQPPPIGSGAPEIRLDDHLWIEEREDPQQHPLADPKYVAVSRRMLYGFAILLAAVGLGAFALGWAWGVTFAGGADTASGPVPCEVQGDVLYARGSQPPAPDDGAVVIVVPRDAIPPRDQRIRCDHLGPLQIPPAANDTAILALRQLGGDYARVSARGRYRLRVPDTGRYFLLVISANQQRPTDQEMSKSDLSDIGTYFRPALDLLGNQQFQWRVLRVENAREVNVVF